VPLAQTSIVYDATGKQIAVFHGDQNRFPVKLDQVPRVTQDAVVSAEDHNFFRHRGIDPVGILRATWADLRHRGVRQGGSTITQQYVKNAYVHNGQGRTLLRKLKEAVIAIKLEQKYSKREVLERYLNAVYFGRGAYGIQAAAKAYFNKDASQLDLKESAYLAGIIRAPSAGDVANDPRLARELQTIVLNAMVKDRAITPAQAAEAQATDLARYVIRPTQTQTTVTSSVKGVEYFVEYVREQLLRTHSIDEVLRGGLRIYTTLDPTLQNLAYDSVYGQVLNLPDDPSGALVSLDSEGRVVAMVGGRDWAKSSVNLALGTAGGGSGRQPGSTFKPFLLAETVSEGYSVESSFPGPAKIVLPGADQGHDWEVTNYDGASYGRINLIDATANSVNTVYAQLTVAIGPEHLIDMAHRLGIRSDLGKPVVSLTLGTASVSVLEMADAYLTFANEGVQTDPRVIKRVTVGDSVLVDDRAKRNRVLEKDQADTVNFILRQVVDRGSGTRARLPSGPAWGKTGTTEDYGDAWFIGFNRRLTTAVWMGYPEGQSHGLFDVHNVSRVNGGSLPAEIWRRYMSRVPPDTGTYPVPQSFGGRPLDGSMLLPYSQRQTPGNGYGYSPRSTIVVTPSPLVPRNQAPPPTEAPATTVETTPPESPRTTRAPPSPRTTVDISKYFNTTIPPRR
jgi:penicillin-binding protein 1A